jgi:integrase
VPIAAVLRDRLVEHLVDVDSGRVFTDVRGAYKRGRDAAEAAGVEAPTLHLCRHGYAAICIAAGVNAKALSTYMGHANIRVTFDQYGHLMPGNEDEAASLLDAYLARQVGTNLSANLSAPVAHPHG